jgi:peptidyl-prolyl cis-trans isomerase D
VNISYGKEMEEKFFFVIMNEVISEGPRPLSEVRSQIENNLREMKRIETAVQNARELPRGIGSLEELAEVSGKEIQSANNLRMGSNSISGAVREPGIIGAVFGLEKGARSGVLEGNNAAFVIEVVDLDVADPAAMSSDERRNIRQQLEQQKYIVFSEVWLDQMKKDANIRDNRHRLMSR